MHTLPTLIIGGGIAGASLACALAERGEGRGVTVADVDVFGHCSSSELNGGGVRCTFAEPLNVKLSLASTRYYLDHAGQFDFRQRGYLWMYDAALWEEARAFLPVVRQFGLPVHELSPRQAAERFPVLAGVSGLAGATFTPYDGRLSPHRLRMHYLNHAQAGGVELLDRWQVVAIAGEAPPYELTLRRVAPRAVRKALTQPIAPAPRKGDETLIVRADRVVNAAGPWAARVAALYGRDLPVTPLPRQVFLLRHPTVDLEPDPFFIDYPQGLYFRHYERDGKRCTLVSWSDPAEQPGTRFEHRGEAYYREHVRPRLAKRIPAMADAELTGGWAGHYELSADKSAIVGPVPARPGLLNYNGLSAHGVMQSRALGVALAEYLTTGGWPADLDLDPLREDRFAGQLRGERMYV